MAKYIALAYTWVHQMESGVLDTPIKCNCGEMTTRRECEVRLSYYDNLTCHNYYHKECGAFVRCDSVPVLIVHDDESEGDSNE